MFSIEKLTEELDPNQAKITEDVLASMHLHKYKKNIGPSYNQKVIKSYTSPNYQRKTNDLPISISDKINELSDYYYKFNKYNNSFLACVLTAIDPNFEYLTNKKSVIVYTKQQLGFQLDNNHRNFGYSRKRLFKKEKMQKYLLDKYDIDDIKYYMIRKYIVDYYNINVIIINKTSDVELVFSQKNNDLFIPQRPTIIMYHCDNRYSIIYNKKEDDGLYMYEKYKHLIDTLTSHVKDIYINSITKKDRLNMYDVDEQEPVEEPVKEPVEEPVEEPVKEPAHNKDEIKAMQKQLLKFKLTELVEYAIKYNIDIYKVSPVTKNKIKKIKKDLIDDLRKLGGT